MRPKALESLACPQCHGPLDSLSSEEEILEGSLSCANEGSTYSVTGGIPHLVRLERTPKVTRFAEEYSLSWRQEGWGGDDLRYLQGLPYEDSTGRQRAKWRVKARSLDALLPALSFHQPRKIVDLGCGMGWLSHRLALAGYEVFALDPVLDATLGLGAAGRYPPLGSPFERIWGEMEHLPFQSGSVDAVVANASLHYADPLAQALREIQRILRASGILIVMNSPVHRDGASAARAEKGFRDHFARRGASAEVTDRYHHFTRKTLDEDLLHSVGAVTEVVFDPGRFFRWGRNLKGLLLRMELAAFPILLAQKGTKPP